MVNDEIDFKGIPWYHMLWLGPMICLVVMFYALSVDDEYWPY